jgi:hypothetical protein
MSSEQVQVQEADIRQIEEGQLLSFEEMDKSQLLVICRQQLVVYKLWTNSRGEREFALDQQNEEIKTLKVNIRFLEELNALKTEQIQKLYDAIHRLHEKRQDFQYAVNDMESQHVEKVDALRAANAVAQQEIAALRAANAAAQQEIATLREANAAAEIIGDVGP